MDLLVDVHTHPGPDVRQSSIDERHPMIPIVGHTAMIVPNFARTAWWSLKLVGVYEYLGGFKWRTYPPRAEPACQTLALVTTHGRLRRRYFAHLEAAG